MKAPMSMRDPNDLARKWLESITRYLDHDVSCECDGCVAMEEKLKKIGAPPKMLELP